MSSLKLILYTAVLLTGYFAHSQNTYSSLREFGLKGKVRKVVSFVYDSAAKENNEWVADETSFLTRISNYFNENGMLDSTLYLSRNIETGTDVLTRTIYQYANGRMSGHNDYENGRLLEEAAIMWIGDRGYLTRVRYPDSEETLEVMSNLDNDFRDWKREIRSFNGDGIVSYCISIENHLESGKLVSTTTKDCIANETKIQDYVYQQSDAKGNPVVIIALDRTSSKPEKIWLRQVEYYQ